MWNVYALLMCLSPETAVNFNGDVFAQDTQLSDFHVYLEISIVHGNMGPLARFSNFKVYKYYLAIRELLGHHL